MRRIAPPAFFLGLCALAPAAFAANLNDNAAPPLGNPAVAQDAPAADAPAPAADAKAEVKPEEKKDGAATTSSSGNARLTVGADATAEKANAFPLHIGAEVSSYAGSGFLQNPSAYGQANYQLGSSLSLSPSASINGIVKHFAPGVNDYLPKMSLSGGMSVSVDNWLSNYYSGGAYDRQVKVSDLSINLGFAELYKEEFTGIKVSGGLSTSAPLSMTSRMQNQVTSLGGRIGLGRMWELPFASSSINVSYGASLRGNIYSAEAATIPCDAAVSRGQFVANPLEQGDLPLAYAREAEILPNGECILRGRQGLMSLGNNLGVSYSFLEHHGVSAGLGYNVGFIRPISSRPDLSSQYSSGQNFRESFSGNLGYSYDLPTVEGIGSSLSVSLSSGGGQAMTGSWRLPFMDLLPVNQVANYEIDPVTGRSEYVGSKLDTLVNANITSLSIGFSANL